MILSSIRSLSFIDAYPLTAAVPAHNVVPMAGESKASAMCMAGPPSWNIRMIHDSPAKT
jgi:hypothetical protein